MDGYANLIAARLRKLAASGSTGMLPVSGAGDGAFFLCGGQVVHAESNRTSLRRAVGLTALGLEAAQAAPPIERITRLLAATELTMDAAAELLSSESRYAKFRRSDVPCHAPVRPVPVTALLTEVERRHRVLRQLARVVTADTQVVRNASPDWPRLQVSPPQWTLIMGIGDGRTPRGLALDLGRSVFATTIEIYRLITLRLLAVPGSPPTGDGTRAEVMSYMRALHNRIGIDA